MVLFAIESSFAQDASGEGVDQLFDAPQADIEAQPTDTGQVAAFHPQPLTISGSLSAVAGGIVGYIDQPAGSAFRMTPGIDRKSTRLNSSH